MLNEQVTAICVTHNTKSLFERCFRAFRRFYPRMQLIIIDGSDKSDPCYVYVTNLAGVYTRVFHADSNIGHGRGLAFGLSKVDTPFALLFDSDTEILSPVVQDMLNNMEADTYGTGLVERTALDGFEYGVKPAHKGQESIRYLHPFFCLISLKEYRKYRPFIHHGAPAINTCLDIHRRGLGDKAIKDFPVWHTSGKGLTWAGKPNKYVRHDTAGTRDDRVKKGKIQMELDWDTVIDDGNNPRRPTIITCTGDRPLAFELCTRWVKNQTVRPYQWLIIDDGQSPLKVPDLPYVDYVRRHPKATDPRHTLLLNIKVALPRVKGGCVFFMEDDEYYAPTYIQEILGRFEDYKIVGIGRSRYYHMRASKYLTHGNMGHASLAQTAVCSSYIRDVADSLSGDQYLDIRIWGRVNNGSVLFTPIPNNHHHRISTDGRGLVFHDVQSPLYVGIKGLPGRGGIGGGHNSDLPSYKFDTDRQILRQWIVKREDRDIYESIKF